MVVGVVDAMLDVVMLHIRHIALDNARIEKSTAFIEELGCNRIYEPVQQCILRQFRGGSHLMGVVDRKQLFEAEANDHGVLYVDMC